MDLPADDLAGMLDRALEGEALDSTTRGEALDSTTPGEALDSAAPGEAPEGGVPAAFARDGAPYNVEDLLSGLEPLADDEARPIVAPPPEPEPLPVSPSLPALEIDEDDVLVLAESEEEGDAADEADEPTLAALSIIADALRALADEPPPPPPPTGQEAAEQTDEILVLTDDFLADEEEDKGEEAPAPAPQDVSTTLTLQSIVAALHALTEPPPAPAEPPEDELLVLTDAYLAPETPPPRAVPKGGLLSITSLRGRLLPALARVLPRCTTPWSSPSMPCSRQFISARRRVLVTSSMPMKAWLRWNWRSRSVRS